MESNQPDDMRLMRTQARINPQMVPTLSPEDAEDQLPKLGNLPEPVEEPRPQSSSEYDILEAADFQQSITVKAE